MRINEIRDRIKWKRYERELYEYNMSSYFFVTLTAAIRKIINGN